MGGLLFKRRGPVRISPRRNQAKPGGAEVLSRISYVCPSGQEKKCPISLGTDGTKSKKPCSVMRQHVVYRVSLLYVIFCLLAVLCLCRSGLLCNRMVSADVYCLLAHGGIFSSDSLACGIVSCGMSLCHSRVLLFMKALFTFTVTTGLAWLT